MPLSERFHLKTRKRYSKHIGLVRSRVNRRPIRYEMKTVSCKRGLSVAFCCPLGGGGTLALFVVWGGAIF